MNRSFVFYNPTKVYFGEDSLSYLSSELNKYGKRVQLIYGFGSIKQNGLYQKIIDILKENNKEIIEDPHVMPNPTIDKLIEGARLARDNNVDLLLSVGGGSCADYAKAVAISAYCNEDPWDKYFVRQEEPSCHILPVACIMTIAGTGSEMNSGSVITNPKLHLKLSRVFGEYALPKFSILIPSVTMSLSKVDMASGIFDIFSHMCEQYFSKEDGNTTDYVIEGLMKSLIHNSLIAIKEPNNYEARSDIMWISTLALNGLLSCSKEGDWMAHMIAQSIGAFTNAKHGMTLSAISIAYYHYILSNNVEKFKRFAINVWNINSNGKKDIDIAKEGLESMRKWMESIGCVMRINELGVNKDMIEDIASHTTILKGGYQEINKEDIIKILLDSF